MAVGIPLISNITQANDGVFWLVDSNAVHGGLYHVNTIAERDSLPVDNLKVGMLCYVANDDLYYKYNNINEWEEFTVGGNIETIDQEEIDELKNIFNKDTV